MASFSPGTGQPSGQRIWEKSRVIGGLSTSTVYSQPEGWVPLTVERLPVLRHS